MKKLIISAMTLATLITTLIFGTTKKEYETVNSKQISDVYPFRGTAIVNNVTYNIDNNILGNIVYDMLDKKHSNTNYTLIKKSNIFYTTYTISK